MQKTTYISYILFLSTFLTSYCPKSDKEMSLHRVDDFAAYLSHTALYSQKTINKNSLALALAKLPKHKNRLKINKKSF